MNDRVSKSGRLVLLGVLLLILSSCVPDLLAPPPYLITRISVINGFSETQNIASLNFTLLNRKEAAVLSMEVEFQVFDIEGNPLPGWGRNRIDMIVEEEISGEGAESVEILLDPLFSHDPLINLTVSEFSIIWIKYADGSRWRDYMGLFRISSEDVIVEEL